MTGSNRFEFADPGVVSPAVAEAVRLLHELADRDPATAPLAALAMALTLRAGEDGHSCLLIDDIESWIADGGAPRNLDPGRVVVELAGASPLVASVGPDGVRGDAPFVLDGTRLYTGRTFAEECAVADALVARANDGRLRVVLGGPGTGKTTEIASRLVELFRDSAEDDLSVALVAPTGKAARRMRDALEKALTAPPSGTPPSAEVSARILAATSARTVHKLLGYSPRRTPRFRHRRGHVLDHDIVIVDEASMMSLSLMHRLLDALDDRTRLWLVGDPDQLASVDAGTVLGDIAEARSTSPTIAACTTILETQHRFRDFPGINSLVESVRHLGPGAPNPRTIGILGNSSDDVEWIDPHAAAASLDALVASVVENADRVAAAAAAGRFEEALSESSRVQILCAHRRGRFGVEGFNRAVRRAMSSPTDDEYYTGRPVMVTRNDEHLGLSNGDVGVVCVHDGRKVVAFPGPDGPRLVPLSRLSGLETVHALTIHKSQGSEYDHAVVVLPVEKSRILTRELLYTGISRPKKKLTVVATRDALETALANPVSRATGLAGRL